MVSGHLSRWLLLGALAVVALAPRGGKPSTVAAAGLTFTVNSTADAPDANPGDGICADSSGQCTLRAAIQEADAQPSGSSSTIDVPAGTYGLTLGTLLLTANNINISGALSSTTIISGNNTSTIMAISPAVHAFINQVTITGGNAGTGFGGGILNRGVAILSQSELISNTARIGGGLYNSGVLTVTTSTFSRNAAVNSGLGGGLYSQGTLTMTKSIVSNNSAPGSYGFGGGLLIHSWGQTSLSASTFSGNSAGGDGGAIELITSGPTVVISSTLSGNSASGHGGGIFDYCCTLSLVNSTLSSNSAAIAGGGIYNNESGAINRGTIAMTNTTLSGNSSPRAGGIYNLSTLTVSGSIIARGTGTGLNCDRPVTDHGYNLDSDGTCGFTKPTDINNKNALLGPLANNGGPTQTMALLPGSPAIDHGGTSATGCAAADQRGMPRPDEAADNGACDMGAYESQGIG